MSERILRTYDLTGRLTGETRVVTELEGLDERWAAMEATALEQMEGPALGKFYRVACNGCGAGQTLDGPVLPDDWCTNERGEFCAACIATGKHETDEQQSDRPAH